MTEDTLHFMKEQTAALLAAPSCCQPLKDKANAWLAAVGTEQEAAAAAAYVEELEADLMPVDGLIAFAGSEAGRKVFGAELAAKLEAHGRELKAAGAAYCDCPACTAAAAILARKADIL